MLHCDVFIFFVLQGRYLQRGSRLEDFDIRLGDAACVPVSLTDNQVDCRPPESRPNRDVNDRICDGDTLSMKVRAHSISLAVYFVSVWGR